MMPLNNNSFLSDNNNFQSNNIFESLLSKWKNNTKHLYISSHMDTKFRIANKLIWKKANTMSY